MEQFFVNGKSESVMMILSIVVVVEPTEKKSLACTEEKEGERMKTPNSFSLYIKLLLMMEPIN